MVKCAGSEEYVDVAFRDPSLTGLASRDRMLGPREERGVEARKDNSDVLKL